MEKDAALADLRMADLIGDASKDTRTSEWLVVPQADIDAFGQLTRDPDPNHIDPEYAKASSPFGGPIAFGFQTLAMLTFLLKSARVFPVDATHVVNYGFDRVRFVAPVPAGASIRGNFRVDRVSERAPGEWQVEYDVEVQVRDSSRPALVARWLALFQQHRTD